MHNVITLLRGVTTAFDGQANNVPDGERSVRAAVRGTGSVSATVEVYGNNVDENDSGVLLGTITLGGTAVDADGFTSTAPWPFMYGKVTAISGTGAAVTLDVGV